MSVPWFSRTEFGYRFPLLFVPLRSFPDSRQSIWKLITSLSLPDMRQLIEVPVTGIWDRAMLSNQRTYTAGLAWWRN
jgi:hypothetical protein